MILAIVHNRRADAAVHAAMDRTAGEVRGLPSKTEVNVWSRNSGPISIAQPGAELYLETGDGDLTSSHYHF